MQEVQLDTHVKLLDCPGLVLASGRGLDEATAVLRNCVKVENVQAIEYNIINSACPVVEGGSCS